MGDILTPSIDIAETLSAALTATPVQDVVPTPAPIAHQILFSEVRAEEISDLLIEGHTLSAICRMPEMPSYRDVFKWMKNVPSFKAQVKAARELRALHFEDRAIDVGTSLPSKDDTPGTRLAVETLKWAAEVNDPSTYGKKTTIEGSRDKPLTFIIQTGFPDPQGAYQKPPELGPDGMIKPVLEAAKEVIAEQGSAPTEALEDENLDVPMQWDEP